MKLSRLVSSIIIFALVFNLFAAAAFAKTSRSAIVSSVSGDVTITKGGGSNAIPAYEGMPLNQGDTITTGEDGTAVITIADPESERTIDNNSTVTISKLVEDAGGKKSGFKVWVGSMWNKVKSLASGNEDDVETPTATMGVRGTRWLIIANPDGTLSVVVASGLVAAKVAKNSTSPTNNTSTGNDTSGSQTVLLAPTQQLNLNPSAPPETLINAVKIVDVSSVVQQASPSIIKAFIIDAPSIADENKQLLDSLKTALEQGKPLVLQRGDAVSDLKIGNLSDLDKVSQNISGLVSDIANTAIKLNKVQSDELNKLIQAANDKISDKEQKIDLGKKPIDPTAGVDPQEAQKKKDEQDRINQILRQQALDRQRQQDQLKKFLDSAIQAALALQKKKDEESKKAQDERNKQAEATYLNGSSAEEQKAYKDANANLGKPTTTPPPTIPTSPSSSDPTPAPTPSIKLVQENAKAADGTFDLKVTLSNFNAATNKSFYGVELHFVNEQIDHHDTLFASSFKDLSTKFIAVNVVPIVNPKFGSTTVDGKTKYMAETIFAATHFNTSDKVSFGNDEPLVTLPFHANEGTYSLKLAYALFVNEKGETVAVYDSAATTNSINVTSNSVDFTSALKYVIPHL